MVVVMFCSGGNPADALAYCTSNNQERDALMGIIIDELSDTDINDLLHYAAAHCDSNTIKKFLHRGADIMAIDSNQCLPMEVAIAYRNSMYCIIDSAMWYSSIICFT
jgi:ankyrin repeat protein